MAKINILDNLTRAGALLTRELNIKSLISVLVEQSCDISSSDLAALYLKSDPEKINSPLKLFYKRGSHEAPLRLEGGGELEEFITDCRESVVLLEKKESPFRAILLNEKMNSGIALPVTTSSHLLGILILNSTSPDYYNRANLMFLDSFVKLAGGLINNAQLYQQLREYVQEIEQLKLYQENIFSSMTNLLITTDNNGNLEYYNSAASESFNLSENDLGKDISSLFKKSVNRKIISEIEKNQKNSNEVLGIQGIFKNREEDREIDFSLNISPLKNRHGKALGSTLLFTDQSRERELQEKMDVVVGERRLIKDMFARYMSTEVVKTLTDSPDLVRPGGDKKIATIFFADIRGYTAFSEGRDPEYIISILNEYFSDAVEVVIKHKGYIDKFIGDCIMAAWGVPLQSEEEDAIQAVGCALEIQKNC